MIIKLLQPKGQKLTEDRIPVKGLEYEFTATVPTLVTVFGHIGYQNESDWKSAETKQADTNAMIGQHITLNNKRVEGTMSTQNCNRSEHYCDAIVSAQFVVQPSPKPYKLAVEAWMMFLPGTPRPKDILMLVKEAKYSGVNVRLEEYKQ